MADFGREFGDIPDDEPCLFLRARDRATLAAAQAYRTEAARLGASPKLLRSVDRHIQAIEAYQMEHGSKIPDLN